MSKIHTHYDNLKVTRNAPPEVIRAAYKSLSQKFHPDRNLNDPKATRTFQIINTAYETLSDPVRRREHDDWILASESEPPLSKTGQEGDRSQESNAARSGFVSTSAGQSGQGYRQGHVQADLNDHQYGLRRQIKDRIRSHRPMIAVRNVSRYLFLTAVVALVAFGIVLD